MNIRLSGDVACLDEEVVERAVEELGDQESKLIDAKVIPLLSGRLIARLNDGNGEVIISLT